MSYLPRRRLFVALLSLTVLSLVAFSVITFRHDPEETFKVTPDPEHPTPQHLEADGGRLEVDLTHPPLPHPAPEPEREPLLEEEEYSYSPRVLGPPTRSFRDNLRNDTKYITSWPSAGWSEFPVASPVAPFDHLMSIANDVMTYANLIYLGSLTERVAIVPMFTPSHIGGDAAPIPFGEVFDVPRFINDSGIEIVEWDEVKDPDSDVVDDLGCWNIWEAVQYHEHHARTSAAPNWIKLGEFAFLTRHRSRESCLL